MPTSVMADDRVLKPALTRYVSVEKCLMGQGVQNGVIEFVGLRFESCCMETGRALALITGGGGK